MKLRTQLRLALGAGLLMAASTAAVWARSTSPVTLAVPGHSNIAPWIAADGSFVAVVWGAAAAGKWDVMLAVSRDGGHSFGAPAQVNSVSGEARISGEIAPRVAVSPRQGADPVVTVTWNAKNDGTQIKTSRSNDGGRTFAASTSLQQTAAAGDRGWHAMTIDSRGVAHAIWLDHRGLAADKASGAHSGHKGEHDGVAMAQKSGIYYASDAGRAERELFKGVCYCCKTALVAGPNGSLYAAWRHVYAGNMRDIAFTVSRDGGKSFSPLARVSEDKWAINGCPDDGPAMAVDAQGTVHLVWPTVVDGANPQGALFYASSRDGRTFTSRVRVPTLGSPKPSHPQIAIAGDGRIVFAWDEVVNGARVAVARAMRIGASASPAFEEPIKLSVEGASTYPVLAATSRGILAVWMTGGEGSVIRSRLLN